MSSGVHPRVSVNGLCSMGQSLRDDVDLWSRNGYGLVGVPMQKVDATTIDLVRSAGVRVSNVIGPGRDRLAESIDLAAALDAGCVVFTTGRPPAGAVWEDAREVFVREVGPVVDAATVPLALEHTNSLRPDVGFVHTLRDAVDVARAIGAGVCVELNACWLERGLAATLRDAMPLVRLVQVSDFVIGTTSTPARAVPGDGDIPLERLIGLVLECGYEGAFDLELLGPRIEDEGYEPAIARSVEWLSGTLDRFGV